MLPESPGLDVHATSVATATHTATRGPQQAADAEPDVQATRIAPIVLRTPGTGVLESVCDLPDRAVAIDDPQITPIVRVACRWEIQARLSWSRPTSTVHGLPEPARDTIAP